jgi:hypothetical protein
MREVFNEWQATRRHGDLRCGAGYVASAPELRQPVTALSLGDLRRRIEALMLPDDPVIRSS